MNATAAPLLQPAGGGKSHAPTRREIAAHLRRTFPSLNAGAANRTASAALDVRRARPDLDVLRWAEGDVQRRRSLAGVPLLLRGADPTPTNALNNLHALGGHA